MAALFGLLKVSCIVSGAIGKAREVVVSGGPGPHSGYK